MQFYFTEPEFIGSYSIPDTHSLDDDKVYFFFKETAVESNQLDKRVYSRVARVCKVSAKSRLVMSQLKHENAPERAFILCAETKRLLFALMNWCVSPYVIQKHHVSNDEWMKLCVRDLETKVLSTDPTQFSFNERQ